MLANCALRLFRVFRLADLALTSSICASQFSGFLFLFNSGIVLFRSSKVAGPIRRVCEPVSGVNRVGRVWSSQLTGSEDDRFSGFELQTPNLPDFDRPHPKNWLSRKLMSEQP